MRRGCATRRVTSTAHARLGLRAVALGYLAVLVMVPLGMILYRSFEHGLTA